MVGKISLKSIFNLIKKDTSIHKNIKDELITAKELAERNEERYKDLLENVEIGVVVHAKDSSITLCNQKAEELLHLSQDQMIGKVAMDPDWNFVDEDESILPLDEYPVMRILKSKKSQKNQVLGVRNSKQSTNWLMVSGFPVFNEKKEIEEVIISFVDVTERKLAEQALFKSKEKAEEIKNRLILASKSAQLGIWDWDILTNTLVWNDRMFEMFELSNKEQDKVFEVWENKMHPDDKERVNREIQDSIKQGNEYSSTYRIIHEDGRINFIKSDGIINRNEDGKPIRMIGINRDITESKVRELELERAKREAERKEQELSESQKIAKVGSWYLDLESNEVEWSLELYKMYGFDPTKEVPPYTEHMKLFTEASWNLLSTELEKTRTTGIPYELELEMKLKDGKTGWMWVKGEAVKNKQGQIVGLRGVAQDITERKNLAYSLAIAEKSDQIKTSFLHNVSHEIRTPLNAIRGFAEILKKPNLSKEDQKKYISIIQNSSDQLVSIISDILTVSTLQTGKEKPILKEVNINAVLTDLYTYFKASAIDNNIEFILNKGIEDETLTIETDETKLRQILSNLLTNAFKFTEKGKIEFGYTIQDEFLNFYVEDSGIGIKKENHEKIFERFNQANDSIPVTYGGTGLGLSISKSYVNLLGGDISLKSELGKGTTFYFSIPYKKISKQEGNLNLNIDHRIEILMAEDQILNFMVVEGLLKEYPVKLIHAKNGKEAIERVKENPSIKLILMDIKMPIIGGDEAAKIIKSMRPEIKIIAQTGFAMELKNENYNELFDDFITKPIQNKILLKKITLQLESIKGSKS